jgi:hypothetical protein
LIIVTAVAPGRVAPEIMAFGSSARAKLDFIGGHPLTEDMLQASFEAYSQRLSAPGSQEYSTG